VYKYQADLLKFIEDVRDGIFLQHSLDDILLDTDGKQLMCEALYLYGTMLLLLEQRIPGSIREKMIIALYRSVGENNLEDVNEVCRLCRSTGNVPGSCLFAFPERSFT
jgi:WASH complex subunit strumpellin